MQAVKSGSGLFVVRIRYDFIGNLKSKEIKYHNYYSVIASTVFYAIFWSLGKIPNNVAFTLMVSSHLATPRTRPRPVPKTVRMGFTVICRAFHTAPTTDNNTDSH